VRQGDVEQFGWRALAAHQKSSHCIRLSIPPCMRHRGGADNHHGRRDLWPSQSSGSASSPTTDPSKPPMKRKIHHPSARGFASSRQIHRQPHISGRVLPGCRDRSALAASVFEASGVLVVPDHGSTHEVPSSAISRNRARLSMLWWWPQPCRRWRWIDQVFAVETRPHFGHLLQGHCPSSTFLGGTGDDGVGLAVDRRPVEQSDMGYQASRSEEFH